jgi:hypothetical protein
MALDQLLQRLLLCLRQDDSGWFRVWHTLLLPVQQNHAILPQPVLDVKPGQCSRFIYATVH